MPLVTSAGTIMIGLLLMGTTQFKLFSTTGPSVALGLAISLLATLSLTPALLVLLARYRPRSFQGFIDPFQRSSGIAWAVRRWPARLRSWCLTLLVMIPLSVLGLQTWLRHGPALGNARSRPPRARTLTLGRLQVRARDDGAADGRAGQSTPICDSPRGWR